MWTGFLFNHTVRPSRRSVCAGGGCYYCYHPSCYFFFLFSSFWEKKKSLGLFGLFFFLSLLRPIMVVQQFSSCYLPLCFYFYVLILYLDCCCFSAGIQLQSVLLCFYSQTCRSGISMQGVKRREDEGLPLSHSLYITIFRCRMTATLEAIHPLHILLHRHDGGMVIITQAGGGGFENSVLRVAKFRVDLFNLCTQYAKKKRKKTCINVFISNTRPGGTECHYVCV
ncbi:hypothetical protein L873DRAFT_282888 [Choiromyces venosus 120613-1]|uniref:Uncharacterized protein n=1 Tax=Choiromyces venosus 120613-1 TaxID=1336337 RepID=A0A3N4KB30_9PEZI|nr:hypothetical protein L873DRAFT_282888 [Choiromyces venosus 120613-1]